MRGLLLLICSVLLCRVVKAQPEPFIRINNTPSKEVYDLLEDRRGFLWLGDNLGVRRFDGTSFTSFTSQRQAALSMSGLCEDSLGRIWCYNFAGQIFYIEGEKMHLLEDYQSDKERIYPRMALCNGELVATSSRGIFICNIATLQSRYLEIPGGIASLSVIGNRILLFGEPQSFIYTRAEGIQPLRFEPGDSRFLGVSSLLLFTSSYKDTAYGVATPSTQLYCFCVSGHELRIAATRQYSAFINTVSVNKDGVWVHTKTESNLLNGGRIIHGYNLSDVVTDRQGNRWYSSLDKGLLVHYNDRKEIPVNPPSLSPGDFVLLMTRRSHYRVLATRHGRILVSDSRNRTTHTYQLPPFAGTAEDMEWLTDTSLCIGASGGVFFLEPDRHRFSCIDPDDIMKDMANVRGRLYIATPRGLTQPVADTATGTPPLGQLSLALFGKTQRCRAVCYDSLSGYLYIAYTDGLYRWQGDSLRPVLFGQRQVYASSLAFANGVLYAGTYGGSLLAIQPDTIREYRLNNHSDQDAILRMRLCGSHLWIFRAFGISAFDTDNSAFAYTRQTTYLSGNDIYDLEENNGLLSIASADGMYDIRLNSIVSQPIPPLYLRFITINNHDTVPNRQNRFSPGTGSLSFYLAVPWLHNNSSVSVRYSLLKAGLQHPDSSGWFYLESNERIIQFNSVKPGSYTLKIEAGVNGDFKQGVSSMSYDFLIRKRWYNHGWFYAILFPLALLLILGFYKFRIYRLTKIEKLRRQISADLHDDIGSTISSINIYSQLIKSGQKPEKYIDIIQSNTVQVINNLDDVVWNINPKNDTLGELVKRMKLFALPYLSDNHIEAVFDTEIESMNKILSPEVRTDFYLVCKEAVNNVVKHAGCTSCYIRLSQKKKWLALTVKDNGKGFVQSDAVMHRNGLTTMQTRARKMRGKLNITSVPGGGTEISLICRLSIFPKIT